MSENTISINPTIQSPAPSTQGMTTKVIKGSLWTLGGTLLPFIITLFATPIIIRFLGSEGYGVLLLVGLIPNYFVFADFGMGTASTKFGSEAYGQGFKEKEGKIVRTAALISLISSLTVAIPIFFLSPIIIKDWVNVPEYWQPQAIMGLRITSIVFVIGIMAGVFNTPQLTRLRMDINSMIGLFSRILLPIFTVLVLYLGGEIIGAIWVSLFVTLLGLVSHLYFSQRLLPELLQLSIDRNSVKPLMKFGLGLLIASIAAILLVNLEKLFLTTLVSVESLAYYSVAFTFAGLANISSAALGQSLFPAFSQLLGLGKKEEFANLFSRSMRLSLIGLLPSVMFLFVIAKPFFTIWAGQKFGEQSTYPFYILLLGLFFNLIACIPHSLITAFGRTDIFAKIYWIELIIYISALILLINSFQIIGAATAWSLRVFIDAFIIIWLAKRIVGVSFEFLKHFGKLFFGILILMPPMIFAFFYNNFSFWLIFLVIISISCYLLLIWKSLLDKEEKAWIKNKLKSLIRLS